MVFSPAVLSCLQYGNSGPSCQQVCLVSDPDGQKIFTGVTFISLFSKYLTSLLKDYQVQADIPTIILPVPIYILQKLLNFLSTGEAVFTNIEDAFNMGKAAGILGISNEEWKIETEFRADDLGLLMPPPPLEHHSVVFTCDVCGKSYNTRGCLIAHNIFKHSSSSSVTCQECPICKKTIKYVRKLGDLGQHINQHLSNRKKYPCGKCTKSFYKNIHLVRHIKSKHTVGDREDISTRPQLINESVFTCDDCGKSYNSRGTLIAHNIFKHSSTSAMTCKECPICKKTVKHVKNLTDLGKHINQHLSNRRKYPCDKCSKSFYKNIHLVTHIKAKHTTVD